jgi:hypothetical protein
MKSYKTFTKREIRNIQLCIKENGNCSDVLCKKCVFNNSDDTFRYKHFICDISEDIKGDIGNHVFQNHLVRRCKKALSQYFLYQLLK